MKKQQWMKKKLKTKNKENKSLRTKETETQGYIYFRFDLIIFWNQQIILDI